MATKVSFKRKLVIIVLVFFALFVIPSRKKIVLANEKFADPSAQFASEKKIDDNRVDKLRGFLEFYNSPLTPYAYFIVDAADRYQLDWRLVPAISGVESSFGLATPFNSFNAYGWNNGKYNFHDWQDGIKIVSKALKEKYMDRGARTVEQIGSIYAESPTWSQRVCYFMQELENFKPTPALQFAL